MDARSSPRHSDDMSHSHPHKVRSWAPFVESHRALYARADVEFAPVRQRRPGRQLPDANRPLFCLRPRVHNRVFFFDQRRAVAHWQHDAEVRA